MNILAIGAHPDDIELLCAGTLARYSGLGHQVHVAIATNGELASPALTRAEIARVRQDEARQAAEVIGATLLWLGFSDGFLLDDRNTRLRFIDALRRSDPDVLLVHSHYDYHPDHRTAGHIAMSVRQLAAARLIETGLPPTTKVPDVFFMDTLGGLDFTPETFVDISDTIAAKTEMLTLHASQNQWLHDLHGIDYVEFMQAQARLRGLQCGVEYAEGFRRLKAYPASTRQSLPGLRTQERPSSDAP
jgi:LmbE family N-acetylglucosaminyl deacetylase